MPSWLTLDFVALNWQPLLVALVLGYVLGWLFTGIPNKRHANEAEDRASSVDVRLRKVERELTDVRRESEQHKNRVAAAQVDLDAANARLREMAESAESELAAKEAALVASAAATGFPDGKGALPADAEDLEDALLLEADEIIMPLVVAEDGPIDEEEEWEIAEFDDVATRGGRADDETQTMLIPAVDPETEWKSGFAQADLGQAFAATAATPDYSGITTAKDIALTEAYARVTTLQSELDRNDAVLRGRQADVDSLRAELAAANAARHELETRLIRAREDVASELAVLASTMIKMKDDALARADARIAALTAETDSLRAQRSTVSAPASARAQIASYVPPKVTAAGWVAGTAPDDDGDLTAADAPVQAELPEMARAVKAMAEEADASDPAGKYGPGGEDTAMDASETIPGMDPFTDANNQSAAEQV